MRIDRDTYADFLLADDEYVAQIIRGISGSPSGRILNKSPEPFNDEFDEYNADFDEDSDFDDDEDDDEDDDDWN